MSWNHYRYVRRKVGARLRVSELPLAIVGQAPKDESVWQVVVAARREGVATLRVWSSKFGALQRKPERHTVTIVSAPEDPNWIVEGD
jgi:hypothetical protein